MNNERPLNIEDSRKIIPHTFGIINTFCIVLWILYH